MIDIFNTEYIGVMRRALSHYQQFLNSLDLESLEGNVPEDPAIKDAKNIPILLVTLDQLPELIKLFQGGT